MIRKTKKISHCHEMVARVAKSCAEELYESLMHDNELFTAWKLQHPGAGTKGLQVAFVEATWGKCIPVARATLGRLCANKAIDDTLKEAIIDALALDSSLLYGRANPSQVAGIIQGNQQ